MELAEIQTGMRVWVGEWDQTWKRLGTVLGRADDGHDGSSVMVRLDGGDVIVVEAHRLAEEGGWVLESLA